MYRTILYLVVLMIIYIVSVMGSLVIIISCYKNLSDDEANRAIQNNGLLKVAYFPALNTLLFVILFIGYIAMKVKYKSINKIREVIKKRNM
jgi:hypothetical protein